MPKALSLVLYSYDKVITSEDIFCDFVHYTILDMDLDEIKNKCYTFRKTLPRGNRSNRNGWQSKVLTNGLNSLQDTVHDFITRALNTIRVKDSYYWININNDNGYNVIHHHCRTDLIAIVYITAPIDSGNLVTLKYLESHVSSSRNTSIASKFNILGYKRVSSNFGGYLFLLSAKFSSYHYSIINI